MIETYGSSVSTQTEKQIVDQFITDSVATFNKIFDKNNQVFFNGVKGANQATKKELFDNYIALFNNDFETLYTKVIDSEIMKLNPTVEQLFIDDSQFMRELITDIIENHNTLQSTELNYRLFITNELIDVIVADQKERFITAYVDINEKSNTTTTLKSKYMDKRISTLTKVLASNLAPFQILTADYNKYIFKKVFDKKSNDNPNMNSIIDNILLQIDFEASIIRKTKPVMSGDDEDRFVLPQNFTTSIDNYKFTTLLQTLRLFELKEVVNSLDFDQTGMFNDKEKSIQISKAIFAGAILTSIFGYIVYMTLTHSTFPNLTGVLSVDVLKKNIKELDKEKLQSTNSLIVREVLVSGVPLAVIVLFITIFNSFVSKKETDLQFNKERINQNTTAIKNNIQELKTFMEELDQRITPTDKGLAIKEINVIVEEDKLKIYNLMKKILVNYDKCNYIIGSNKNDMPFPYAEVFADGLIISVIIGVIFYIIFKFAPLERLFELKDLYEYKEAAETLANDPSFVQEITMKYACHTDNVESIMMTVKLVFATSIIVFMFLYTVRVVNSTNLYKIGLYNSKYFEKSTCCN